jgi:hypothetical protein
VSKRDPGTADRDAADEPFLQRWSRLKSATRDSGRSGSDPDDTSPPPNAAAGPPAVPPSAEGVGPSTIELPDLDSLGPDSDYSAFLAPDVDSSLRRTALRRLFRSAKFNVCDGLDDYCEDFSKFAPMPVGMLTADMRHHAERAAKELLAAGKQPGPPASPGTDPTPLLPDDGVGAAGVGPGTTHDHEDEMVAAPGTTGDTADPATEEPETDADRRPA